MSASSLSRAEWDSLEHKAKTACEAISDLQFALLQAASESNSKGDSELCERLILEANRIRDLQFLPAYFYHCQPEWTGGDSLNPANTVLREPHIAKRRNTVL